jgi:Phosphoinositide phospholipase C, Ca2+-dependent
MSTDYLQLRYNEVSFKAAHNSYQRDETLVEQLAWHPSNPAVGGCRGVELDVSQSSNGQEWSVGHDAGYRTTFRQLSQFLAELRAWGRNNPGHDVITVYLDLKQVKTAASFPDQLDGYIRGFMADCGTVPVFSPAELWGATNTLPQAARYYGWPTLGELRDRFIFVLTGVESAKQVYASTSPHARLCFCDRDRNQNWQPVSADRVFFNYHLFWDQRNSWCPIFQAAAPRRDAIIRGYELNGQDLWNRALSCGCHALATNRIKGTSWAKVGSDPFARLKPLG